MWKSAIDHLEGKSPFGTALLTIRACSLSLSAAAAAAAVAVLLLLGFVCCRTSFRTCRQRQCTAAAPLYLNHSRMPDRLATVPVSLQSSMPPLGRHRTHVSGCPIKLGQGLLGSARKPSCMTRLRRYLRYLRLYRGCHQYQRSPWGRAAVLSPWWCDLQKGAASSSLNAGCATAGEDRPMPAGRGVGQGAQHSQSHTSCAGNVQRCTSQRSARLPAHLPAWQPRPWHSMAM